MNPIVSIIMGSTSDLPIMEKAAQLLNDLHVPFEMNALSRRIAHPKKWKHSLKTPKLAESK